MEDAIFASLSKEQLFEGFSLCRENAKQHMNCAQLMFEKEIYGIANSHLILGAEEAIKATLILAQYFNVDTEIKSIKPYFKKHEIKHEKGKEMDEAYKVIIPIINALKAILRRDVLSFLQNALKLINSNESVEWWKRANDQKNKGFYVDYTDGKWISPTHFSTQDYSESKKAVQDIFDMLKLTESLKIDDYKLLPYDNL